MKGGTNINLNDNNCMKRAIVSGVIGLAAAVATTFGQGEVVFDSYLTSTSTVLDDEGSIQPLGAGFTAALVYSLTPVTDWTSDGPILGFFSPAYQYPDSSNPENGLMTASFFVGLDGGGYFNGSGNNATFILPTYTGNALVYFEVLAYNGSSYESSTLRAHSAAFSQALAVAPDMPVDIAFQPFSIALVPEPATSALGGLGLAALFLFRRKQV